MGKVSLFCIIIVVAVLLEDVGPVKRTKEEEREDRELAEKVNATLAEEDEKKKTEDGTRKKETVDVTKGNEDMRGKDQDEACPPQNSTCPIVRCGPCPVVDCHPCPDPVECGPCPEVQPCVPCKDKECPEIKHCPPCGPCRTCPVCNETMVLIQSCNETSSLPQPCRCMETSGLTVPVAMIVGTITGLVAMGLATALGLFFRYVPPVVSGLLFLFIVLLTWFLSSRYPDVAREAGGRIVAVLREATSALGHRIAEAIRHHPDQVGLRTSCSLPSLSSIFHLKSFALRFSV
jgi:hypothetical protein